MGKPRTLDEVFAAMPAELREQILSGEFFKPAPPRQKATDVVGLLTEALEEGHARHDDMCMAITYLGGERSWDKDERCTCGVTDWKARVRAALKTP